MNSSGLQLAKLIPGVPAVTACPIGIDASGNVVAVSPFIHAALIADVAASNTASDVAVLSATCPANTLFPGSSFRVLAAGKLTVALTGGVMNFWIKFGSAKIVTVSYTFGLTLNTNYFWEFEGLLTFRSLGASGVAKAFGTFDISNGGSSITLSADSIPAVDTTQAQTISFGFNWNAAGSGNVLTATQAVISPL